MEGHVAMPAPRLFNLAVDHAKGLVPYIREEHYHNPTPCNGWDTRTLLNHMIQELSWLPDLLTGKALAKAESKYKGDVLGKDCVQAWQAAVHQATQAVTHADLTGTVRVSLAKIPAEQILREVAADLMVHAWDLAQSIWVSLVMQPEAVTAMYEVSEPKPAASWLHQRAFADAVDVPESANLMTKLLARYGRTEPAVV